MSEGPANPDHGDDTFGEPLVESAPSTPLWVKVFGIIALVVIVTFVVLLLIGGNHGPGRHSFAHSGSAASSSGLTVGHAPTSVGGGARQP